MSTRTKAPTSKRSVKPGDLNTFSGIDSRFVSVPQGQIIYSQSELFPSIENYECVSTDSDQRFTPASELIKIKKTLGGVIGLDPFANPQKTVPALNWITEQDDCFATDWRPYLKDCQTVFGNPPYSNSAPYIGEMCGYVDTEYIRSAVTLTLAGVLSNKKTQNLISRFAVAISHPFGRINFDNSGKSNDRDVVYILWGRDADVDLFREFMGGLVTRVLP